MDPTPIDDPNINQLKRLRLVGCLNGLVCILHKFQSFVLWNSSTRNFKKLPQPHEVISDRCIISRGFGWDESSDAYKVFALVHICSAREVIGKVYSSDTNSWKTLELVDLSIVGGEGMFVGGKLHWNTYDERVIRCFDLKTEVWGTIKLPYENDAGSNFYSRLGVIGGCLSSVKFNSKSPKAEVWMMKEYGVKESWSKLIALSQVQELVQRPLSSTCDVGGDGEDLLSFGRLLLVYYPRHNEFQIRLRLDDSVGQEKICVESLVWPQFA